jgi:hypothetical protein
MEHNCSYECWLQKLQHLVDRPSDSIRLSWQLEMRNVCGRANLDRDVGRRQQHHETLAMSVPRPKSTDKWLSKTKRKPLQQLHLVPPNFVSIPAPLLVGLAALPNFNFLSLEMIRADNSLFVRTTIRCMTAQNGKTSPLRKCLASRRRWTSSWRVLECRVNQSMAK